MKRKKNWYLADPDSVTLGDLALADQMGYQAIINDGKLIKFVKRGKKNGSNN